MRKKLETMTVRKLLEKIRDIRKMEVGHEYGEKEESFLKLRN